MDDRKDKFEEIIELVGHGKFQKRFNYVFNLFFVALITAPYFNIIIALSIPDHWCYVPGRDSTNYSDNEWKNHTIPWSREGSGGEYSRCTMYNASADHFDWSTKTSEIECQHGWIYDDTWFKSTIPSQENWVCDKEIYVTYALMCSSIAEVAGTFFLGWLGDRFGRRPVFLTSITLLLIGRLTCTFSTHIYPLFMVTIFLGSFASNAVFQCPLVIAMEMTKEDNRATVAFLQQMGWNLAFCVMPLIYWYLGTWFPFMLITTTPIIVVLVFQRLLIESPRWLAIKGKTRRCIKELQMVAKINNCEFSEKVIKILNQINIKNDEANRTQESICSSWILIKTTIYVCITWIVSNCLYNINLLNTSNIGGNPFMNYFWLAVAEMPGNLLAKYLSNYLGRRLTRFGTFSLATLGSFCIIFFIKDPNHETVVIVLSAFTKFNVSMIYYVLSLHTLELYPTPLRQTGMSISTIVSGIVGICSPYVIYLGTSRDPRIPYIVCTCLGLVGVLAIIPVPETLHQNLPETVKEAEELGKNQRFWSIPHHRSSD